MDVRKHRRNCQNGQPQGIAGEPQQQSGKPKCGMRQPVSLLRLCSRALDPPRDLRHDPKKWMPVFGKDHARTVSYARWRLEEKSSRVSVIDGCSDLNHHAW